MNRPICELCTIRPAAVNYHKNGKIYYRSLCTRCINPYKVIVPGWMKSGYKLKATCDLCNFKRNHPEQMTVFHVDGDMRNNKWPNLRSICANCAISISIKGIGWKQDTIHPDF